jgi:hypothetical protein
VRAYVFVQGVCAVLPLLEVCVVVLIFVKFDEPLIGVVYLVSLQPDLRNSIVDRASSASRGAISVQG